MHAIDVLNPGPYYRLELADTPVPQPRSGEILIKTAAAGINRADLLQANGKYPPPPGASARLGMEVSGVVAAVGSQVEDIAEGEVVCALLTGGGYADYALAAQDCVLPVPNSVPIAEAAGLPEAFFTVWTNLFDTAAAKPGESVLVHGGSSGVGTAAIQLCAALGLTVFATAGSAEKCAACEALGAARAINYRSEDYVKVVCEATAGKGVEVILDMVGGDYIARNFEAAAIQGRIVNIAFQVGATATVDFAPMLKKRLTFAASTLRPRGNAEKRVIRDLLRRTVWPLIEAGKIKPVIDRTYPLADAAAAHARMASGEHIGKILLVT